MSDEFTCPSCWANIIVEPATGSCPECGDPLAMDTLHTDVLVQSSQSVAATAEYVRPMLFGQNTDIIDSTAERASRGPQVPEIPGHHSLRHLGAGGMSYVYYGVQDDPTQFVAIKVLHPACAGDFSQRRRFAAEMNALSQVQHPNVIPIITVGESDDRLYYTMQLMPHGSLHRQIRHDQPAHDFKAVARWLMQAGRGVAAGHALNILHRDIKPSNILLNDDDMAMIADYGLAKFLDEIDGQTQTQVVLGTANYMPPEQAMGRISQLNFRSDVYSLGATLYHMLTGQTPFKAASTAETLRKVIDEELPRPRSIHPSIPKPLERICLKAIEKNPADRYDSAEAFARDLARYLENQPTVGRPVSRTQKVGRFLKRNRVRIGMVTTALIVSLAIALRPAPKQPPVAEPPSTQFQIEAALARGEEVVLVGETGRPSYYRWTRGDAVLYPSDDSAIPARFQTAVISRMVLVEDPTTEHYRVHAEFHQEGGITNTGPMGLCFGFDHMVGDKLMSHSLEVQWSEFYGGAVNIPIDKGRMLSDEHSLSAHLKCDVTPDDNVFLGSDFISAFKFIPYDTPTAGWRTIEVDASPEGLQVRFQTADTQEKLEDAFFVPSYEIEECVTKRLEKYCAATGIPMPAERPKWTTRGTIGIRASNAIVSFRNVTLTPLE